MPDQVTIMIICLLYALFLTFFQILKPVLVFNPVNCGNVCNNVKFLDVTSTCFPCLVPCLQFTYVTWTQKQVTDVSLVLKDSDIGSENLSSLIRLSVSDGQKTRFSYRYIIKCHIFLSLRQNGTKS